VFAEIGALAISDDVAASEVCHGDGRPAGAPFHETFKTVTHDTNQEHYRAFVLKTGSF
jgi:hypothetical protein